MLVMVVLVMKQALNPQTCTFLRLFSSNLLWQLCSSSVLGQRFQSSTNPKNGLSSSEAEPMRCIRTHVCIGKYV